MHNKQIYTITKFGVLIRHRIIETLVSTREKLVVSELSKVTRSMRLHNY